MAEYTPTEAQVRDYYALTAASPAKAYEEGQRDFDRWLAEVRREAAETAWGEGWDARHHYDERGGEPAPSNPHTKETT